MDAIESFRKEVKANLGSLSEDTDLQALSRIWVREASRYRWAYNFEWLGRPAIQFPNDAWGMQEIIWKTRPDLIIETGIAHGGSLVFYASMLALLDLCEALTNGVSLDPANFKRKVLGIDIDIRAHNRRAIEDHPLASRIEMVQGSSVSTSVIENVREKASGYSSILVCLDSNHTHDHVLAELEAYAPLTSRGSYCVVFDTIVEDMPADMFPDRPWGKGDNPKTAVHQYLEFLNREGRKAADGADLSFEIDREMDAKLQISVAPSGYLKRV